jgi:hypothetical protein
LELAADGVNPAKLGTFRSLVIATAVTRRPGLKPSTLSALLRTAERLRSSIEAAPPRPQTGAPTTEVVEVDDDPDAWTFLPIDDPAGEPSWRAYVKRCAAGQ